jgi:hypothetical protein
VPVWPRALLLAATVLGVGSVSHGLADGLLPGPTTMLVLLAVATAVLAPFLRSAAGPASPLRLVVLTVGGQAIVHLVLGATAGHTGPAAAHGPGRVPVLTGALPGSPLQPHTVDGRRVGSLMDQALAPTPVSGSGDGPLGQLLAHPLGHALAGGPWMLLAHTAAATALGLWLALGERALWELLVLLAVRARRACVTVDPATRLRTAYALLASLPDPALARPVVAPPPVLRPAGRHHPRAVTRRGPPLLLGS